MPSRRRLLVALYWAATLLLFAVALAILAAYTPAEATMGVVQKIFYLHMPVAVNALAACLIVFIAGIGYLWRRTLVWDDLALAAAKVAVLLCSVVLVSGMFWARGAWGQWWTWSSPRLTFSFALWLLYVVYLAIRPMVQSAQRRALVSAAYGIVAFLDVPLVYLSARLIPDVLHPPRVEMVGAMKLTLAFWFLPVTLLTVGLIVARFNLARRSGAIRSGEIQ